MNETREQLVKKLRWYYGVPASVSDDQVLELTEGALGRASIELGFALSRLRAEIKAVFSRIRIRFANLHRAA